MTASGKTVAVIGGGASGLMAAIAAARSGARVTVFEAADRVGKKILVTGNGRCNLTNAVQEPEKYRTVEGGDPFRVIRAFDRDRTLSLFCEMGVWTAEKDGWIYPRTFQAASVLNALRFSLEDAGVNVLTGTPVESVSAGKDGIALKAGGERLVFDAAVLSAGGTASRTNELKSARSGFDLARMAGHRLTAMFPALGALTSSQPGCRALNGTRLPAGVTLETRGKTWQETGEVQFTAYGLSGIPVFQLSRFAAEALKRGEAPCMYLDLFQEFSAEKLRAVIRGGAAQSPRTGEGFFVGLLPKMVLLTVLKEAGIRADRPVRTWSEAETDRFIDITKHFAFPITGTTGLEKAQVTAGGVPLSEVDLSSMRSKIVPGLYLAGEVLDVDGTCGGYNLQWAWSSGVLAGMHAAGDPA